MLLAKQPLYQLSYTPARGRPALIGREAEHFWNRSASRFNFGTSRSLLLRKEVIQPLVPQRLPCYDFIPITTHTLGGQTPDFGCRRLS